MALHVDTVVEIRTTGANTNGGGWANVTPGTSVDYTQQNAPQLALVDIATDAAGTKLTSATGGFTAAMEGSVIFLTGGVPAVAEDWYQIITGGYIDGNNVTIDRSAGANKAGATGNLGGAYKIGVSAGKDMVFFSNLGGPRDAWIKSGSYGPMGTNISFPGGGAPTMGRIRGYDAARGDNPTGTDRPLIDMGDWAFNVHGGHSLEHVRLTGTGANVGEVVYTSSTSFLFNLRVECTGVAAGRHAIYAEGSDTTLLGCQASTTGSGASYAIYLHQSCKAFHCFAHDSQRGFYLAAASAGVSFSVADHCEYGFTIAANSTYIHNCLAYSCTYAYRLQGALFCGALFNNIADACTFDFWSDQAAELEGILTCGNCMDGATNFTMLANWYGNVIGDAGLKNPAADDFRVDSHDVNVYELAMELTKFTTAIV